MIKRALSAIALLVLLHSVAFASAASELASRAFSSENRSSFTGVMRTTLYVYGKPISSDVKVQRLQSRSRMEYTSGSLKGLVLIESGGSVYRLDPATRTIGISEPPQAPKNLKLLLANYRPTIAGSTVIAGRKAHILRLDPINAGNPRAVLAVDTQTGVVLRNERYLYDGKLESRSDYKTLSLRAPSASVFRLPAGWKRQPCGGESRAVPFSRLTSEAGFAPLKPSYVPKGYVLTDSYVQNTCSGRYMIALKYSNGLNSISVFERVCAGCGFGRRRGSGMCCGGGRCIMRSDPQAQFVQKDVSGTVISVISDLSPSLLRKMAESF